MLDEDLIQANLNRKIIHVDMDCFYAAVELLERPELKNQPIAIGGNANGRGIICTSNYVARKYGVRSAMSSFAALKLCPNLTFLPLNFEKYRYYSAIVREVFYEFTDKVETLSLDEAFLDVTSSQKLNGSGTLIAKEIKNLIFERTNLTASAGVSVNKMLAKVASDWRKPNGLFVIKPSFVSDFVKDLPVRKINGIGKVSQERLSEEDIYTCQDLYPYSLSYLVTKFGKFGKFLFYRSRGIDLSEVGSRSGLKSMSSERTFSPITNDDPEFLMVKKKVFGSLAERISRGLCAADISELRTMQVKVKFSDFSLKTHEIGIEKEIKEEIQRLISTGDSAKLFCKFEDLIGQLLMNFPRKSFRLLGMGFKFKERQENSGQLSLFHYFSDGPKLIEAN